MPLKVNVSNGGYMNFETVNFFLRVRHASQTFSNSIPVERSSIRIEEDRELILNNLIHCLVQLQLAF